MITALIYRDSFCVKSSSLRKLDGLLTKEITHDWKSKHYVNRLKMRKSTAQDAEWPTKMRWNLKDAGEEARRSQ